MPSLPPQPPPEVADALRVEVFAMGAGGRLLNTRWGPLRAHGAFPFLSDCNHLHLRTPLGQTRLGVEATLDEITRLMGACGVDPPPRLLISDPQVSRWASRSLTPLGYVRRGLTLMVRDPRSPLPPPPLGIFTRRAHLPEELDRVDAIHRLALSGLGDELAWQVIAARRQELEEAVGLRFVLGGLEGDTRPSGAAGALIHGLVGSIQWVRTEARHQGRGVARAMIIERCRWLVGRGVAILSLITEADNAAAQRLYGGLGFTSGWALEVYELPAG